VNELLRHLGMVLDAVRVDAYREALASAVRPGAVVADLGAGCGILSVLACQAGAGRVYAVEPAPIADVARRLVASNGCADRVRILDTDAAGAELPEPVDLLVSDLRGTLPLRLPQLAAHADFADRWLAPGGAVLPLADRLLAAPCRHPASLHRRAAAGAVEGVDLGPLVDAVGNSWWRQDLAASAPLAAPRRWAEITYPWRPAALAAPLAWELESAATADGLALWFEAELVAGVGYTTAPGGHADSCYGQAFFPFAEPFELAAGDELAVELRADPAGGGFVWTWEAEQRRAGRAVATGRRSTFYVDAPGLLDALRPPPLGKVGP